jgi:hypothetical protein
VYQAVAKKQALAVMSTDLQSSGFVSVDNCYGDAAGEAFGVRRLVGAFSWSSSFFNEYDEGLTLTSLP